MSQSTTSVDLKRKGSSLQDNSWLQLFGTGISRDFKKSKSTSHATYLKHHITESGEVVEIITDDVDFAPYDYDGQIRRCQQRIQEGFARETYEMKIQTLKAQKAAVQGLKAQYRGRSWEVIQRIGSLQIIAAHLEERGDPLGELPNVYAIIWAYENGQLQWDDNATYWCQGRMIAGPSPFSWDDFRSLNTQENRGHGGFWVEGIFPLAPSQKAMIWMSPAHTEMGIPEVPMIIRLDASIGAHEINRQDHTGKPFPMFISRFQDDTGSDFMTIRQNDMHELMGNDIQISPAPMAHLMGYSTIALADGRISVVMIISLEVNMQGTDEQGNFAYMHPSWTTVPCGVFDRVGPGAEPMAPGGSSRLAGPFLRSMFYVGSAPGIPYHHLYAGSERQALLDLLPTAPEGSAGPPRFRVPPVGANWAPNPATGFYAPSASMGERGIVPPNARGA
ncbi:hypothetical protein N7493_011075 [Penicillium malachiteum]|uniref:Uncharacterized protein n=1 Tax=Penicillium malachiteum TaxID=1324776 RepID=A0AAD6HBF1_9EURO|nr:hypothetical protein N7493_011075 [Penicillium malachiteum]